MRKLYLYILAIITAAGALSSCSKEDVAYYDKSSNGIYFNYQDTLHLADSINFADFVAGDMTSVTDSLQLKLLGYVADTDRKIVLKTKEVPGYPLPEVEVPELTLKAGEINKKAGIKIYRPEKMNETYAVAIYIDSSDPGSQLGEGIEGFSEFRIYVKEAYTEPADWAYPAGNYLGAWSPEKYIFMVKLTKEKNFYTYQKWDYSYPAKAVDSVRTYNQAHPDAPMAFALPFATDAEYNKPYYWNDRIEKYFGTYTSKVFTTIATACNLTTANEAEVMTGNDAELQTINKQAVAYMMQQYNMYFSSWGLPGNQYKSQLWIPMQADIDYEVTEPACWSDSGTGPMLKKYYGDYSAEKYKFMIKTWLEHKGTDNFVLVQMFPVMNEWGNIHWDTTLGGEAAIQECYKVFKATYDKAPAGTYHFTFPTINE